MSASRLRRGRPFEFVIVDGRMSSQGGLDAVEEIATHPASPRRRVLVLGSGDTYDPARAQRLGIATRLLKPVMEEELRDAISRAIDGLDEEQPAVIVPLQTPGAVTGGGRRLRILVVEDNEFNQDVLAHLLTSRRHAVSIARDGHEAISLLGREAFDLVFLDVHLPGLDGFEVARRLRKDELRMGRSGRLPVIALTARARPGDRERCLESGMDDYLTKPLRAAELWSAIDRALPRRDPDEPASAGGSTPFSRSVLIAACGDDDTMLGSMCNSLAARAPEHLERAEAALQTRDAETLREVAHKMNGLVSAFSTTAANLAGELEEVAETSQWEEARDAMARLPVVVTALLHET